MQCNVKQKTNKQTNKQSLFAPHKDANCKVANKSNGRDMPSGSVDSALLAVKSLSIQSNIILYNSIIKHKNNVTSDKSITKMHKNSFLNEHDSRL